MNLNSEMANEVDLQKEEVVGDCNGGGVHEEGGNDNSSDDASYVLVENENDHDPIQSPPLVVENSVEIPSLEINGTIEVEEEAKLGSDVIVEDTREPISEAAHIVESELDQQQDEVMEEKKSPPQVVESDSHQLVVEDQAKSDSQAEAADAVELVEVNGENKVEEEIIESAAPAQEEEENQILVVEIAEQSRSEETPANVCQNSQVTAVKADETEGKDCEEAGMSVDEIPVVEEQSMHHVNDNLKLEDSQVELEAPNGTDEIGRDVRAIPVEQAVSEIEVVDESAERQEGSSACPIDHIESEPPNVNGHVETTELSSSSVDLISKTDVEVVSAENGEGVLADSVTHGEVESETDVKDISTENGEGVLTDSVAYEEVESETDVKNISTENGEGVLADPVSHAEVESETDVKDVSTENGEGDLADPVAHADLKLETDVKDVSTENGEGVLADPVAHAEVESETDAIDVSTENGEGILADPVTHAEVESETDAKDVSTENGEGVLADPVTHAEVQLETDVKDIPKENGEGVLADPVTHAEVESEVGEISVARDENLSSCAIDDVKSEAKNVKGSIEGNQSIPDIPDHDLERETIITNGFTGRSNLPADPVDVMSQSEYAVENSSLSSEEDLCSNGTMQSETPVSNGLIANVESNTDYVNDVKSIECEDQSKSADINSKATREVDGIEGIDSNGSASPPEDSTAGPLEGIKVDCEVEKRPFRYLIRVPRYNDDKIRNQIEMAQKQVDERTQNRDNIRSTIQSRRAVCGEYRDKFEAARSEERAAREARDAKRREMDSVQSVINRMKDATSVEDINERVRKMEHRIEHETVPLKEEKQLIREIKQLKQAREQFSSSLSQQTELQPTSDERIKIEERYKHFKQEMESCRKEVMRLEGITRAAWKIYSDENEELKKLQTQFRGADDLRQEAYIQFQNLKKQLYEKNKYFRMYKDDAKKAEDYAIAGDKEALQNLCVNQVEAIMELWNKHDEFRNDYVRCNTYSTVRRLRTLDGRGLGPDEEPPILRSGLDGRVDKSLLASANKVDPQLPLPLPSTSERGKSVGQDVGAVVNLEKKKPKAVSKTVLNLEQKQPTAQSKTITKPAALENSAAIVSAREDKQENNEEIKKIVMEEEPTRKAEELRKEAAAAKLKEQRRLEEKVKAKEAEERKRRNAEKAQARAELRAQKEAELKEKEREKRAKKKERKKEKVEGTSAGNEAESASISENTQPETVQEPEIKEKPKTVVKRSLKPSVTKPKVTPPPLRIRSKKRMQQWMWILLVVVAAIALFLVGNFGFSFNFGLPSFGL